jgi:hypothetical protein
MDPTGQWSRRRFIGATADAGLIATVAGALKPLAAMAGSPGATVTLFDPRFETAQSLARDLAGGAPLQAATQDPTDLVLQYVAAADAGAPLRLQGVTTDTVPFCLRQLLPDATFTERRVDRDLFIWTLEARS